jgi:kynurenine formamidase
MFIDLTLTVDVNDPIIAKASNQSDSWMSRGHIGTHLDVYPGQELPPVDYVARRGLVVDVTGLNGADIDIATLDKLVVKDGDFLIFHTGHLQKHVYGSPGYFKEQPKFTWELVEHVAASNVAFIGLDFPGMRPGEEHGKGDRIVGLQGGYVIENLTNVEKLYGAAGDRPFRVLTGWTGFKGASGLSCRVVAEVG